MGLQRPRLHRRHRHQAVQPARLRRRPGGPAGGAQDRVRGARRQVRALLLDPGLEPPLPDRPRGPHHDGLAGRQDRVHRRHEGPVAGAAGPLRPGTAVVRRRLVRRAREPDPPGLVAPVRRRRPLQLADRPQARPDRQRAGQAGPRSGRLRRRGVRCPRRAAGAAMGEMRHHERRLGLQLRCRELLPAGQRLRPGTRHLRRPGRQLPAEHRPQGRRLGHRRIP